MGPIPLLRAARTAAGANNKTRRRTIGVVALLMAAGVGWGAASAATTPQPSPYFTMGRDARPPAVGWTKPALGRTVADPVYGLPVTRLTSADGTRFDRNTYSRRQPENAQGTMFMTYHGNAHYRVYRVGSNRLINELDIHPDAEPQWHPERESKIRHLSGADARSGSLKLYQTTAWDNRTTVEADLTARLRRLVPDAAYMADRAEGSPSRDGNRYVWMLFDRSDRYLGLITYDLATDTILGLRTRRDHRNVDEVVARGDGPDAVDMAPSGRHVVVQHDDGTFAYPVDLSAPTRIYSSGDHSDIAVGRDGHDHYVYVDFADTGWVIAHDLDDGSTTRLIDMYDDTNTSIHFSGKAYKQPGWVVASTYNCKETSTESFHPWACNKVFALDLHTGQVVNLAHTYNCGDGYWTETHAATNDDLTRIYFNSDGGSCGIDAEVYRIDLPPAALDNLIHDQREG